MVREMNIEIASIDATPNEDPYRHVWYAEDWLYDGPLHDIKHMDKQELDAYEARLDEEVASLESMDCGADKLVLVGDIRDTLVATITERREELSDDEEDAKS